MYVASASLRKRREGLCICKSVVKIEEGFGQVREGTFEAYVFGAAAFGITALSLID